MQTERLRVEDEWALERPDRQESAARAEPSVRDHVAKAERRAKALGWFSIGLGLIEIAACRGLARAIGVRPDGTARKTLRVLGFREIATGVGLLARPRAPGWLLARVVGDVMDIALLARADGAGAIGSKRLAGAAAAVAAVGVVDAWTALELKQRGHHGISVRTAITVNRPIEEVYRYWRNLENLPRFMRHLEAVETTDGISRWRAKAPGGVRVEWQADVIVDRENEMIAWRSHADSELQNRGSVQFLPAPGDRGTEVRVQLDFDPPGGVAAAALAKLFGNYPEIAIEQDLRRFKQIMEIGEVVESDASIHDRPHPARPPGKRLQPAGNRLEEERLVAR